MSPNEIMQMLMNDTFRETVRKFRQISAPRTGWAQSGTLTTGSNQTASMQATFGKSGTFTIQFNRLVKIAATTFIGTEADVTWSQSGNFVTRTISIVNGSSISGQGEAAKVSVRDVTGSIILGREYDVTMQVTEGVRASNEQPPILIPRLYTGSNTVIGGASTPFVNVDAGVALSVAPSTVSVIQVPQNAGIISVNITAGNQYNILPVQASLTDQSLSVRISDSSGIVKIYNPIGAGWQPILPGSTTISLANYMAAGVGVLPIQFSIAYGIDG